MSFELSSVYEGHSGSILSLIQLKSENIASGSKDCTVRFWNKDGNSVKLLKGHTDTVSSIVQLKNGRVASSSFDKTIKIWYLDGSFQRYF